ncbi:lipid-A-disaccharide synthase N-terminal domain-containing protein [Salinimicrobium xinjiangense]|uniref:lipid-A-disaccharide synthase N-terminal domain-containing protein n=1 Tax=Salinimicrobium xinjiangense TaxID=438596 RepID=UPI0004148E13|nr:lipid-A-disaccharide synthase N-terminal domain-containing protein [Salinimicrobium xinjiangense]
MNSWQVFSLGFIAQLLFTGRFLFQWIASEKAKQVVTPSLFWKLSLFGSFLLLIYGMLRNDLAIISGQVLIFGIYIRNLKLQGEWNVSRYFRLLIWIFPPFAFIIFFYTHPGSSFFDISSWLLILGLLGQVIFALRFVIQWLYSEKVRTSVLPLPFWTLSLSGSALILLYAFFRQDPVLMVGHLFGSFIYIRNISLIRSTYVAG